MAPWPRQCQKQDHQRLDLLALKCTRSLPIWSHQVLLPKLWIILFNQWNYCRSCRPLLGWAIPMLPIPFASTSLWLVLLLELLLTTGSLLRPPPHQPWPCHQPMLQLLEVGKPPWWGKDLLPANDWCALRVREARTHTCFTHSSLSHRFCPISKEWHPPPRSYQ